MPDGHSRLLKSLEARIGVIERLGRCAGCIDSIVRLSDRVSLLEEQHTQDMRKLEDTEKRLKAVEVLKEEKEKRLQVVEEELQSLKQHLQEQHGPPQKRPRGSVGLYILAEGS